MGIEMMIATATSICSCITGIAAVIALCVSIGKKAKAPDEERDRRLTICEERIKEHDLKLNKDLDRLNHLEVGDSVTQKALLALLRHGIDGNHVEAMEKARDELNNYLINHSRV